ncbi:hypothetical protein BDZ89DRAFT_1141319 [Hymenopellis radicata]|nr:hypothetical protein BDZ89DRAFT_1141319 [Hymenopellis radicata]
MTPPPSDNVEVIDLTLTDSESDSEEHGMPGRHGLSGSPDSDDESNASSSRAALHKALSSASEPHLRRVIAALVDRVPAVEQALAQEFLVVHPQSRKVAAKWETCRNCGEEFEVDAEREAEECIFHPGDLEGDEEEFVDWDEDCHGPIDTAANRRQFPEFFQVDVLRREIV